MVGVIRAYRGRNWDPQLYFRSRALPDIGSCQENKKTQVLPLLKNLSWSLLPTIITAPLPPFLSLFFFAVLHCSRHSLSTVSSAGLNPWLIIVEVKRLSCPLCISMTHRDGLAKRHHKNLSKSSESENLTYDA